MQLEAEELSHGAFPSLGDAFEHFMDMYPPIPADPQESAVHETYACAFPKQHLFDEQCQRHGHLSFKFHETVIGYNLWKEMAQMAADLLQIEMFQTTVLRVMEQCTISMISAFDMVESR